MTDFFDVCFEFLLREEGGYVDHPDDPGGATNMGITLRTLRRQGTWADADKDGDVDANDVRLLTRAGAAAVYRADYWLATGCHLLPNPFALALFDGAVNMGPVTAATMLQAALKAHPDGVIGTKTAQMAHIAPIRAALDEYAARRTWYYATRPRFPAFGLGWLRRAVRCHSECLLISERM